MKRLLIALVALAAAACSQGGTNTRAPEASSKAVDAPNLHRFHVGSLEAIALKDGDIFVPNDGKTVGIGQPTDAVAALLARAGRSTETIEFSIQPLVIRDGERTLLFDTGAGDAKFAKAGRLPSALRAAAIAPSAITDVFISHGHPDHVGGLVTTEGTSAFPKARIHVAAAEWASMQANEEQTRLVSVIASQVDPFAPNASIRPNVTAVEIRGHTPGHTAYRIGSGSDQLLFIGDTAHHSIVSVEKPEWTIAFDLGGDRRTAEASRGAMLEHAAKENVRVFAGHFPFPGLGRIQKRSDGFVWTPETEPTRR